MQLLDRNSMGSNTTVALGELFSTRNCIEESKIIQPCPPPHGCHSTYSARVSRNLCFPKPHSLHVSEICALLPAECWSAVRIRFQAFSHHKALNCDGKTTDMDEHVVGILLSRHCCVCARPHDDIQQSATVFPRHPIAPFVSTTLKKLKFKRCSSQLEIPSFAVSFGRTCWTSCWKTHSCSLWCSRTFRCCQIFSRRRWWWRTSCTTSRMQWTCKITQMLAR